MKIDGDMKNVYEEYKIARDSIQLTDAYVKKCSFSREYEFKGQQKSSIGLSLYPGLDIIKENKYTGNLKATIDVKQDEHRIAEIVVVVEGNFQVVKNELNSDEVVSRIKLQLVPQLLPYVRSAVSNIGVMMGIHMQQLPTMDILRSIQLSKNKMVDNNE